MPEEPDDVLLNWVDPYHAAAIVSVISAWAGFEYDIDETIWQLAGLEPEPGACLTSQYQTVAARFDALISLARVQKVSVAKIDALNALRSRADSFSRERNRIVHDPWFFAYETKRHYRLQRTAKAKLEYAYRSVTEEELKQIEVRIADLRKQFCDLRHKILKTFWSQH